MELFMGARNLQSWDSLTPSQSPYLYDLLWYISYHRTAFKGQCQLWRTKSMKERRRSGTRRICFLLTHVRHRSSAIIKLLEPLDVWCKSQPQVASASTHAKPSHRAVWSKLCNTVWPQEQVSQKYVIVMCEVRHKGEHTLGHKGDHTQLFCITVTRDHTD